MKRNSSSTIVSVGGEQTHTQIGRHGARFATAVSVGGGSTCTLTGFRMTGRAYG